MQEGSKAVAKSYGKCREFVTFFYSETGSSNSPS